MSSVAIMTESNLFARQQRSQKPRSRGLPAIACSGLPGKRVEPQRAGMIPAALLIAKIHNYLCRRDNVFRHPVRAAAVGHLIKTSTNANRAHAGVVAALGVDFFVANEKRAREINVMITHCLKNHSGSGLAAFRGFSRGIGAEVGIAHHETA